MIKQKIKEVVIKETKTELRPGFFMSFKQIAYDIQKTCSTCGSKYYGEYCTRCRYSEED